jgi:hypothetical protein
MIKKFSDYKKEGGKQNYMFFNIIKTMKRILDDMENFDPKETDRVLTEHDWASDHISVATENLEQVYNFFKSKEYNHH